MIVCFCRITDIRGIVDTTADSGDHHRSNLIRRVDSNGGGGGAVSGNTGGGATGGGSNGLISSTGCHPDFTMMDPLVHDHAFQQQILQVSDP